MPKGYANTKGTGIPVKASNGMIFPSLKEAAKYANVHAPVMSNAIRKDLPINGIFYAKQ
jgi:hypothetical protein